MKKRIAIDITPTQDQFAYRGVGTAARNIINKLLAQYGEDYEWHLVGFGSYTQLASNIPLAVDARLKNRHVVFHSLGEIKPSTPLNFIHWRTNFHPKVKKINPDLYICLEFQRGFPTDIKTIVFIHDVIPVVTNSYSPRGGLLNAIKGALYRRMLFRARTVSKVITNSKFSATEISRVLDIPKSEIKTIYLAPPIRQRSGNHNQILEKFGLLKDNHTIRYIQNNGGFEANKNPNLMINSFVGILKQIPELYLVIVGKMFRRTSKIAVPVTPEAKTIAALIDTLDKQNPDINLKEHIVYTGFLSDEEMQVITENAEATIYLSSYEGFGLPAIESMAVQTVPIVPNSSCFPEVTGGHALLVELDESDIIHRTVDLLTNTGKLNVLRKQAQDFTKKYNWEKTATEFIETINEVLK